MAEQPKNDFSTTPPQTESQTKKGRAWYFWPVVGLGVIVGIFLIGLIAAVAIALLADPDDAANWVGMIRDVFIIVLAMEGMLMGVALIVLVIQIAALINLLQNEIQPIVDNASETMTTVRGTTQFVSQNLVEPVIKTSAFLAGSGAIVRELVGLRRSIRSARNGNKK
jgi:hypothetical protein